MAARVTAEPVLVIKAARHRTVEIKHARDRLASDEGHHEFRAGSAVAGDVPGKGMHIGDDDGASLGDCRAAHTSPDGNTHAGRLTLEGPEHELLAP